MRDNKNILTKSSKLYKESLNNGRSGVYVYFRGKLTFTYKEYQQVVNLTGLRFGTFDKDIKVVEDKNKAIICLDTSEVYAFDRLEYDCVRYTHIASYMSLNDVLCEMGKLVWDGMYKSHPDLFKEMCEEFGFGSNCVDRNTFKNTFSKYMYHSLVLLIDDYVKSISYDNFWPKMPNTVYLKDSLVGLCCFDFKNDLVTFIDRNSLPLQDLAILSKSTRNRYIGILNISSMIQKDSLSVPDFFMLVVHLDFNGSSFTSYDGLLELSEF